MIRIEQLAGATPEELLQLGALSRELHEDKRVPTAAEVEAITRDTNAVLLVVRDDERIVGMATLYLIQKLGRRTSYLEDVVILSEYRGQGLGKRLVEAIIAVARERGAQSISLTSRSERVAAHKLYESAGFVKRDTNVFKLALS